MLVKKDFLKIKHWASDDGGAGALPYTFSNILDGLKDDPFKLINDLESDALDLIEGSGDGLDSIDLADLSLDFIDYIKRLIIKAAADIDNITTGQGVIYIPLLDQFKKDPCRVYNYLLKGAKTYKDEPTVSKWFKDLLGYYKTLISLVITKAANLAGVY